jgi:hypothetical protein
MYGNLHGAKNNVATVSRFSVRKNCLQIFSMIASTGQPVARSVHMQDATNTDKAQMLVYESSGIESRDPSVQAIGRPTVLIRTC